MIVGLTGGFASGKSEATKVFKRAGFLVIDVDKIGHSVLQEEKIKTILRKKIGDSIFDNEVVNRKKLGTIVFKDKKKLQFLNTLLHKLMRKKIKEIMNKNKDKNIVIDAALLYEMKLDKYVDKVLFITADDDIVIKRGKLRNHFSETKIRQILEIQKKSNKRKIDSIIVNNGTKENLMKEVDVFIQEIQGKDLHLKKYI